MLNGPCTAIMWIVFTKTMAFYVFHKQKLYTCVNHDISFLCQPMKEKWEVKKKKGGQYEFTPSQL